MKVYFMLSQMICVILTANNISSQHVSFNPSGSVLVPNIEDYNFVQISEAIDSNA